MPLMRGKLFAGLLFAGKLFGALSKAVEVVSAGVGSASRRIRKILVEQVEDLDDFIDKAERLLENKPKAQHLKRKAKKVKPESKELTTDNVQAWVDYFQWKSLALLDTEYAVQFENILAQYAEILQKLIEQRELQTLLAIEKRRKDEEELILLLLLA